MAIGTHKVEVVPVQLEPHPNADSLSIVRIFDFTVCVRTADWQGVNIGAYIQPDSVVPDTEQFAFLKRTEDDTKSLRIRVKKLRGVISMGMLIPAPEGSAIGDDVAERIDVEHYEPAMKLVDGETEAAPSHFYAPKYDIESIYRYSRLFEPGEMVCVTEKIHGANSRFCFDGERMWTGSRGEWKKSGMSTWSECLKQNPWIEEWCRANPMKVIYGEMFGRVQSLRYGANGAQFFFRAFDVMSGTSWLNAEEFAAIVPEVNRVPLLGIVPFDFEQLKQMAEGQSLIPGADHIREGIVIRPMIERQCDAIGRVQLKMVSNAYLEKSA